MADAAQAKRRKANSEMSVAGSQRSSARLIKQPRRSRETSAAATFAPSADHHSTASLGRNQANRLHPTFPRFALRHIKALCSLSAPKANLFAGCFENAPVRAVGTREH